MYSKFKNVKNSVFIRYLIIYLVLNHQVSSHSLANRTGKTHINRKNDKLNRFFDKHFDELSNHGSELRHSVDRNKQQLNISITVSDPLSMINEFTEMQTREPFVKEHAIVPPPAQAQDSKPANNDCQCTCDPYQKANQIINDYILKESEDPDMDVDDNEDLEKLQKPYKYIPMETIELAHQRPQHIPETSTPPSLETKITKLVTSVTNYLTIPKFSTKEYLELGVSLFVTGVLGIMGFSSYSPYIRRQILPDRNHGYYQSFYGRQVDDKEDPISRIINKWIQSLE